jgi:IS5 family transposase
VTPTWQFFSGQAYFEHHRPCDATTLIKFRQLLGEEGVEELLAQTINVAVDLKLIKPQELTRVIVDSTVQHKAIAHPTDSRLLETARAKLVEAAKDAGIDLKQTFAKEGKELGRKAGRYAHARQFKRMRRAIKRQRTIVGRLQREVEPQGQRHRDSGAAGAGPDPGQGLAHRGPERPAQSRRWTTQALRLARPEVDCISKGKASTPYEFGVKVGIASTLRGNLIVGARAFHGNPYDGHTLNEQLEQATILMQDSRQSQRRRSSIWATGVWMRTTRMCTSCTGARAKRISEQERKLLKRRQAIEPIIGHLKADHRMDRCHLKGEIGDRLHAVLCAAGYNIRWLLRMIVKKGVAFLRLVYLRLCGWRAAWAGVPSHRAGRHRGHARSCALTGSGS